MCQPVYVIGRKVCRVHGLDSFLSEPVDAMANHGELIDFFARTAFYLALAWRDSAEPMPTRILTRYSIRDEQLDSDFEYEPLDMREGKTWIDLLDRWVDTLRERVAKSSQ